MQSYTKQYLREQIGIVEQQPFLFSASIKENIAYAVHRTPTDKEIRNAAEMASIAESIEAFPQKYETMVGEKGVTLSGGQKQRIAIARTILKDPAILILDDSTSAVDSETEKRIKEALESLMKGRTTFIIAHRISTVLDADQILVFKDGTIVQQGTHHSLMKDNGFYKTVFTLQSQIENDLQEEMHNV